jgi:hypothetical protein
LGGGASHRLIAILFGTVVSGYTGLLRPTDIPMGFNVKFWHLSEQYFDDPTTLFAYVPQHLFSVACLMAVVCFATSRVLSRLPASIVAAILLASGMLSSAILALVFLAAAIPLLLLVAWPEKPPLRSVIPSAAAGGAVLLAIAGPFIFEYMSWAGTGGRPQIKLVDANFLYTALTFGPVSLLALVGFIRLGVKRAGRAWELYAVICGFVAFFWLVVSFPDLQLKTSGAMRFLLIPAASIGFVWVWQLIRGLWVVRFAITIPIFVLPTTATLLETAYFASSAYIARSPEERALLEAVDQLPSDAIIGVQQPEQSLAASLGGRLTVMDFRGSREDAYLPAVQRSKYAEMVDLLRAPDSAGTLNVPAFADALIVSGSSSSGPLWAYVCGPNAKMVGPTYWLLDLRGCGQRGIRRLGIASAIKLEAMNWQRWGAMTSGSQDDPATRTVSSPTEGDFGLISPVRLLPGVYRIRANIAGAITGLPQGAAHISLHGREKLINIQPGNYEQGKDFTGYSSMPGGFQGYIAFGLGGWSRGAGWIRLNALTIERISAE